MIREVILYIFYKNVSIQIHDCNTIDVTYSCYVCYDMVNLSLKLQVKYKYIIIANCFNLT